MACCWHDFFRPLLSTMQGSFATCILHVHSACSVTVMSRSKEVDGRRELTSSCLSVLLIMSIPCSLRCHLLVLRVYSDKLFTFALSMTCTLTTSNTHHSNQVMQDKDFLLRFAQKHTLLQFYGGTQL